jgi:septum site-determining protein MinC
MEERIIFKGNSEGLVIVIPKDMEPDRIFSGIEKKIVGSSRFFKGARMKVTYRGACLSEEDENRLKALLDEKSGAIIESFSREEEAKQAQPADSPAPSQSYRRIFTPSANENNCRFIRSTVRNGTRIQYGGSVLIIGDVNPGAEIIASGNVIVLGALRGLVHAGADGDKEAFVYALCMKPTQIRIADMIACPSGKADDGGIYPEIAAIKNGTIVLERV